MNVVKCCDFSIMWFCLYFCIIIVNYIYHHDFESETYFLEISIHHVRRVFFAKIWSLLFDMSHGFSLSCTSDDMAFTWPKKAFLDVKMGDTIKFNCTTWDI